MNNRHGAAPVQRANGVRLCAAALSSTTLATTVRVAIAGIALGTSSTAGAEETWTLPEILVTAPAMDEPLTVVTDPRTPRQPLPAHDGADYLKTIPGFSVTRKGGTDGDASFRGMSGSRLGILVDGESILGSCNARMDAPTSYIYPELYDSLTVIKGAHSVQHGPGNTAATVLFERKVPRFGEPGARVYGSLLGGSFDRHDELVDAQLGDRHGYLQLTASNSTANDYRDGDGNDVHSQYERYSLNGALGWTPDADSRVELAVTQSDGEAAYADRAMDGTKFLREGTRLRVEKTKLSPLFARVEAQAYRSDVDHVMDDQTLRTPGMMGYSNLVRETRGGKAATALNVGNDARLTLGIDARDDAHRSRSAPVSGLYTAWSDDADIHQDGVFAEFDQPLGARNRVVAGIRGDRWQATDLRTMIMIMGVGMQPNATAGHEREEDLGSGFARIEHTLADAPATLYAGISQGARFPDYWELIAKRGATSNSAFDSAQAERARQLDLGVQYREADASWSASLFYNETADFLLIDYGMMGLDRMMVGVTRNIDATTYGGELGGSRRLAQHWQVESSLAYTRGRNETDDTALAQVAPLEARVGVNWKGTRWSAGGLLRAVDDQHRYDLNRGSIVGKDLGAAPGYAVFSLNAGWKPAKNAQLSAGIDNLFDRRYAEFISRSGSNGMGGPIPGYAQTTRVNEPGRTFWLKASLSF